MGGFTYLFRGLKMILGDRRLLKLAAMPLLVNIAVFALFFLSFNFFAFHISSYVFTQSSQEWYWALLSMVTGAALFVISILAVIFTFTAVGLIIASPFNDALSRAVEEKLTGGAIERKMPIWALAKLVMANESRKMALLLAIQALLFLMNLVPGIGNMAFVAASGFFVAFAMAYEFAGYTLDRRGYTFAEKRMFILSRPWTCLGFGLAVAGALLIPFINLAFMPVAVAGGSILAVENDPALRG
ncbi:MAG: EI24 domain-containing protein [Nitrospinae bacterium]|nr:EI24 domain-containing protein [Nitrospinota bacterium]